MAAMAACWPTKGNRQAIHKCCIFRSMQQMSKQNQGISVFPHNLGPCQHFGHGRFPLWELCFWDVFWFQICIFQIRNITFWGSILRTHQRVSQNWPTLLVGMEPLNLCLRFGSLGRLGSCLHACTLLGCRGCKLFAEAASWGIHGRAAKERYCTLLGVPSLARYFLFVLRDSNLVLARPLHLGLF